MTDALGRLTAALADRYAIERELGQGGMATVYLARDHKLGRSVALKILRPELAAALGSERFLREIEIAAKLAHPHILALHDCGEADGLLYYTMPFVEGESLRDRLSRERQLPLEDALRITREVADALGYAHALGLVHRDIKPENILFQAGHAVVSDFGIAKAIAVAGTARLTETGLAVGTPAYMSPEQAAGSQDLDGRSDLYSLGCVLYEMLAGDPPFYASTPQAVVAKKLSEPLPRISVVREAVPPGIEAALNKALARTPADRWVTASDFAAALAHPETMTTAGASMMPTGARPRSALARLRRRAGWAAGVVGVAAIALAATWLLISRPLTITTSNITQVTSDLGMELQPAISPDGNEVAYLGPVGSLGGRLHVRSTVNIAGSAAVGLGDTTSGCQQSPTWTPDGQSVRYWGCGLSGGQWEWAWRETGKLGGAVRTLTAPPGWPGGAPWSPDGARVVFSRGDTLFVSSAADTLGRRIAVHPGSAALHSWAWSPDGKRIAYVAGNLPWRTSGNVMASSIWVVDVAGGVLRQVAGGGFLNVSPAWLDARRLLFVSDRDGQRAVYAVEVGPEGPRGAPRAIPGIADAHTITYSSASRHLAFSKAVFRTNIFAYPLGGAAPISIRDGRPVTAGTQIIETLAASPDGQWIVYSGTPQSHSTGLYKLPAGGGQAVPLTTGMRGAEVPAWSSDAREIVFGGAGGGGDTTGNLWLMSADGRSPVALTHRPENLALPLWAPSGREISYARAVAGRPVPALLSRDSAGGAWRETKPFADCLITAWAPDGSGALCQRESLLVLHARDGRVVWRRDLLAEDRLELCGYCAAYSRDSKTLYSYGVREGRRGVWAIPVGSGAPRLAVAYDAPGFGKPGAFTVGPDRLYLLVEQDESDIWVADLRW